MNKKNEIDIVEKIVSPYEKVLKMLEDLKSYLEVLNTKESQYHLNCLKWVIQTFVESSLHAYDLSQPKEFTAKPEENIPELGTIINYMKASTPNFSDPSEIIEQEKIRAFGRKKKSDKIKFLDLQNNDTGYYRKKYCSPSNSAKKELEEVVEQTKNREKKRSYFFKNFDIEQVPVKIGVTLDKEKKEEKSKEAVSKSEDEKPNKDEKEKNINLKLNKSSSSSSEDDKDPQKIIINQEPENKEIVPFDFEGIDSDNEPVMTPQIGRRNKPYSSYNVLSFMNKPTLNLNRLSLKKTLNDKGYQMKDIISKDFDIFKFKKIYGYINVLPIVGANLYYYFGLSELIEQTKLENFLFAISSCYIQTVLYHNAIHGTDVTLTFALFLDNSDFQERLLASKKDILAVITACLGHDLGHPGLNNKYLINSLADLAINYNDISVLENFHAANLFRIVNEKQNNIFEKFSRYDFVNLRKRIIKSILATDMDLHRKVMDLTQRRITADSGEDGVVRINPKSAKLFDEQQEYYDFVVHTADIAHNAKKFELSVQWVEILTYEFWLQGDKEKKNDLPVSELCDRENVNIPKSQVGFVNYVIVPVFEKLIVIFPTLTFFLDNAKKNLEIWKKLTEEKRRTGFSPPKK